MSTTAVKSPQPASPGRRKAMKQGMGAHATLALG